jgi:hypothetical protein
MMTAQIQNDLIQQFRDIMMTTQDDLKDIQRVIGFLSMLQTHRVSIPPTAEMITVIKYKKPILYQYLKKSISPTSHLFFILQLDMDYATAIERLELSEDPYFIS